MFKLVIVLMLIGVLGSLFAGLFFLLRGRADGERTVKALTLRIGLSLVLFALLIVAHRYDALTPG